MRRLQYPEGIVPARLLCGLVFMLVATCLALGGCKRDADGQLPEVSGEKIVAKREAVQGFGLVAAYPDQKDDDELAIALEFSRPLVGTQEFDSLISVTNKDGTPARFPRLRLTPNPVTTIASEVTILFANQDGRAAADKAVIPRPDLPSGDHIVATIEILDFPHPSSNLTIIM